MDQDQNPLTPEAAADERAFFLKPKEDSRFRRRTGRGSTPGMAESYLAFAGDSAGGEVSASAGS